MSWQSINNEKKQDYQLPSDFYDNVSQIIKLFRKQLTLYLRIQQNIINQQINQKNFYCSSLNQKQPTIQQLLNELHHKKQQAINIIQTYQQFIIIQKFYSIIQRIIGRIKQIVQLTLTNNNTINQQLLNRLNKGIKKLQLNIHKNMGVITIYQIISQIVSLIPSSIYYNNNTPGVSPQKSKITIKQQQLSSPLINNNKQNIPSLLLSKQSSLNSILQSYKKSYSLLSILDIDESQYRSVFFAIRQDRFKQTQLIDNDMKIRNRFIRQQIKFFDNGYITFKQRLKKLNQIEKRKLEKKNKKLQSLQHNNQSNHSEFKNQYDPITPMKQKNKKSNLLYNYNKANRQFKLYTNFYYQKQRKKTQLQKRTNNNNQNIDTQQSILTNINQMNQTNTNNININDIKIKGQFRMTKVLFGRNGKLQLTPNNDKTETINQLGMKNKIIVRKVQQCIRKKLNINSNRINTQPNNNKNNINPQNQLNINISLNKNHKQKKSIHNFQTQYNHPMNKISQSIKSKNTFEMNNFINKNQTIKQKYKFQRIKCQQLINVNGKSVNNSNSIKNTFNSLRYQHIVQMDNAQNMN